MAARATTALLLVSQPAAPLDNGVARTPPMGWNSWYDLAGSDSVVAMNESMIMRTADAMVKLGLPKLGYTYISLDDGYVAGRDSVNGSLYADKQRFPSGMAALGRHNHARDLLFGIYTARCAQTCCGHPGSLDHEEQDACTFALDWKADLVKEDSCAGCPPGSNSLKQYTKMGVALNKTGRHVAFALCGLASEYFPQAAQVGNLWRIGTDDGSWNTVLDNVDASVGKAKFAGPGGWNDPCMLNSRDHRGRPLLTELQTRAQMSMWSVLAAPLIISGTLLRISDEALATYTNAEVIAVDQDPLGRQGERLAGGNLGPIDDGLHFTGPAAIAAPCVTGRPAQNWSFVTVKDTTERHHLRNAQSFCANVASGAPNGMLDVEGFCGNNSNLELRLAANGEIQTNLLDKTGTQWNLCVNVRQVDHWIQMGPCGSGSTHWQHDLATGQLKPMGAGNASKARCLDWAPHILKPHQATNVWGRPLVGGEHALVFLNVATENRTVTCNASCFKALGYNDSGVTLQVRDLWAKAALPPIVGLSFTTPVLPANGGHMMIKVGGKAARNTHAVA